MTGNSLISSGTVLMSKTFCYMIGVVSSLMIYICYLQLGSHSVALVQYTFTHKQYTEQHKINNIYKKKKIFWKSTGRAPSLRGMPWHLPYK